VSTLLFAAQVPAFAQAVKRGHKADRDLKKNGVVLLVGRASTFAGSEISNADRGRYETDNDKKPEKSRIGLHEWKIVV
jgi:hypothetical protein